MRGILEQAIAKARLLKQIELFDLKYNDYHKEEPSAERITEYVEDDRWMLPIL